MIIDSPTGLDNGPNGLLRMRRARGVGTSDARLVQLAVARGMLGDCEGRRGRHGECEHGRAAARLRPAAADVVAPGRGDDLGRAEQLDRGANVAVARRVVEVIAELCEQPLWRAAARLRRDLVEVVVGVHSSSTASTLAVKLSQSCLRPSSALRPRAVSS